MKIKQPEKMAYQPPIVRVCHLETVNVIAGSGFSGFENPGEEPL